MTGTITFTSQTRLPITNGSSRMHHPVIDPQDRERVRERVRERERERESERLGTR